MAEIVVEKATLKSGIFSFKTKSGQAAFYVERQKKKKMVPGGEYGVCGG